MASHQLQAMAKRRQVPQYILHAGMSLSGDEEVQIRVLHPPAGFVPGTAEGSNDNSIVLQLTKGQVSVLLTGDLEEDGIPWLLAHEPALRAAVLKVPHHGSRLGDAGERLFRAVRPHVAILSVGRAHGLPAEDTVRALHQTGAAIYSTRDHGAVRLRTDGVRLEIRGRAVSEALRF